MTTESVSWFNVTVAFDGATTLEGLDLYAEPRLMAALIIELDDATLPVAEDIVEETDKADSLAFRLAFKLLTANSGSLLSQTSFAPANV